MVARGNPPRVAEHHCGELVTLNIETYTNGKTLDKLNEKGEDDGRTAFPR
jgi:hypothetical protein